MKKLFLLLFVVAATTLVSCEGDQGPPGIDGVNNLLGSHIYDVRASDWDYDAEADIYYLSETPDFIKELSDRNKQLFYDEGLLMVYLITNYGTNNSFQQPLPTIEHWTNNNGVVDIYDFSFNYTPKDFQLLFKYSGDPDNAKAPDNAYFRVVGYW